MTITNDTSVNENVMRIGDKLSVNWQGRTVAHGAFRECFSPPHLLLSTLEHRLTVRSILRTDSSYHVLLASNWHAGIYTITILDDL